MGKTLQYVKEFTFAKGGAVGACGDNMGYAKGGATKSCSPAPKQAYKKGGGVFEKAMVKREAEKTPRAKMPARRMVPVASMEPMIAMKKGGAMHKMPDGKMMAGKMHKAEGGKVDMSQDKAMIKKAFKQHDAQEHKGGKGTSLALKKGGMAKMMHGGMAMKKGGSTSNC